MKKCIPLFWILICLFAFNGYGQAYPPSNLSGSSLRSWLKTNWHTYEIDTRGYTNARRQMYNYIDNKNNKLEGIYTGYLKTWYYGGTGTNPSPINCEHIVPRSFFNYNEPMNSDIHHLAPVHGSVNSLRGNLPFAEIPDNQTTRWYRNGGSYTTSMPSTSIRDEYAEYKSGYFEPREEAKGDIARAVFYFYTMYPTQAGPISDVGDINTFYQWHLDDPVTSAERQRNTDIAAYQGNRNPYVDHPELVAQAWGFSSSGGGGGSSSQLFISEYVEGSSNNKALEIANRTGGTVNMSGYSLKKQTNGSGSWGSTYNLSGSLGNGQVWVIANSSATSSLRNRADVTTGAGVVTFNGNDPIGLFYNGTLIDIVGTYNGGSSYFASNVTKRRNSSISSGNTTYTTSEWTNYSSNTFGNVGSTTSKTAGDIAYQTPEFEYWPNPVQDRLHLQFLDGQMGHAELIDLQGRVHYSVELSETVTEMDLADFAAGIYILRIRTNDTVLTKRIVKN